MRFRLSVIILCASFALVLGCEGNNSRDLLITRVNQYYLYEKYKNWEQTYMFRTKDFRDTTKINHYIKEMERENLGWKLEGVEIKDIVLEGRKAHIVLTFKEIPPEGYFDKLGLPQKQVDNLERVTTESWAIWIFENGNWYCQDADARSHL